ncbi:hypothetical protein B566_EDAN009753 [Ephemera danica]|nr:hypothetical protein B566_EDAN009753 [Ephemera danica]
MQSAGTVVNHLKMADNREPPPLSENNSLFDKNNDEPDDLFASALEEEVPLDKDDTDTDIFAEAENAARLPSSDSGNITAPVRLTHSMHRVTSAELERQGAAGDDQEVLVTVTDPQKVGEGMGAYVAYRVTTRTNMQIYRKKHFSVMRRFSDFLGLHDKLAEKYLRTGRIVPPAPEKSVIGSTKIKMTNQADQGSSADFVERRRASLERYLNRTAMHPILQMDLPRATNTSALSGAGMMRLFNKVGETVNKITYKMEESDPWFEEKVQQIEGLDNQMRRLLASAETLVEQRRELACNTAAFAKAAAMLSNCEEHNSLSRALAQLAEVEEKVESLYADQSNADFAIFCELIKDYVALIGAIKDVFHERVKWEGKVERGQEEFDNISKMIKKEMERFDVVRVKDFKAVMIKYIESLMNNQQQLIKYWDSFLPEAKAIA